MNHLQKELIMSTVSTGARHAGPNLLVVAIVYTLLFALGLSLSTWLAGGQHYPSPFGLDSSRYFRDHADAVRLLSFFQFGCAIPLGIFTATAVSRLRFLGVDVAGVSIALFGGFAAALFLALSALASWVIAQPAVLGSDASLT